MWFLNQIYLITSHFPSSTRKPLFNILSQFSITEYLSIIHIEDVIFVTGVIEIQQELLFNKSDIQLPKGSVGVSLFTLPTLQWVLHPISFLLLSACVVFSSSRTLKSICIYIGWNKIIKKKAQRSGPHGSVYTHICPSFFFLFSI